MILKRYVTGLLGAIFLMGSASGLHAQSSTQPVVPRVDCVLDLGNNHFVAYFGYDNPNERDVLEMRGPDNQLDIEVGPDNQPPQRFYRNGREETYPAPFNGVLGSVTWTLQGTHVTAFVDSLACDLPVDHTFSVEPATVTHTAAELGGNFVHYFSKTPGRGMSDAVADHNLATLQPTHIRVSMELAAWEPVNDNDATDTFNWDGFADQTLVHDIFAFMQAVEQDQDIVWLASLWRPPSWLLENPDAGRRLVVMPGMEDELVESMVAWLVHARDEYGLTIDYVSINEPNLGVNLLLEDPAGYADIVKRAGARFVAEGLSTKWAIGDTSNGKSAVSYSSPIWEDVEAQPYIGGVAFHSWDAGLSDIRLGQIADWAESVGLSLWVTETGHDSAAWETPEVFETWSYALDLAVIYSRLYRFARPQVTFYWQMMDDYRLVSQDGATRYPAFNMLNQLRTYVPPGAEIVELSDNGINEIAVAARTEAGFTLHVINTGLTSRVIDVSGLPDGTYSVLRLSADEPDEVALTPIDVVNGELHSVLMGHSVTVFTTMGN